MRSRLKNIGCFSDGQNGFLIVDEVTAEEIKSFYDENGINKTAENFIKIVQPVGTPVYEQKELRKQRKAP